MCLTYKIYMCSAYVYVYPNMCLSRHFWCLTLFKDLKVNIENKLYFMFNEDDNDFFSDSLATKANHCTFNLMKCAQNIAPNRYSDML